MNFCRRNCSRRTGLKIAHVPYKGGAQAGQDVAGGQAQMMFSAALEAKPVLATGKTRAIAISSLTRSAAFPNIPTVAESANLPGFQSIFWQGMVVPAGTPKPIVDKLQKAIAKVAADPDVIERFKVQGVEIRSSTQAEFKTFYLKRRRSGPRSSRSRASRASSSESLKVLEELGDRVGGFFAVEVGEEMPRAVDHDLLHLAGQFLLEVGHDLILARHDHQVECCVSAASCGSISW